MNPTCSEERAGDWEEAEAALERVSPSSGMDGGNVEDHIDPAQARQSSGEKDDEVGQFHQLCQDLGHIVDKSDDLALGQAAGVYLPSAEIKDGDDAKVDEHIGQGDLKGRRSSRRRAVSGIEFVCLLAKTVPLLLLLAKGPDHPDPQEIFPGGQKHSVQLLLHVPIEGHGRTRRMANTTIRRTGMATAKGTAALTSTVKAMIIAPKTRKGSAGTAGGTCLMPFCTWLTSLVIRLMRVEVPMASISW